MVHGRSRDRGPADAKKARRWAGPKCSAQCALELGDAANLLRVLIRLGLDGPSRLIGSAQRQLRNALVGVNHLLQAVPHQVALNRHKVLHRADTRKAGTGLLAIFAELAGACLALNELAPTRASLLERLFAPAPVSRHDAEQIHDHLQAGVRPSVVLMNPPFSASPNIEGRVAGAALKHLASALARLAEGGRLVAVTGASLAPDRPADREAFARLQERGRVVFTAALDGRAYARHGTTTETRLTVIDRVPADDLGRVPGCHGIAADVSELLALVERHVPPGPSLAAAPGLPAPVTASRARGLPGVSAR